MPGKVRRSEADVLPLSYTTSTDVTEDLSEIMAAYRRVCDYLNGTLTYKETRISSGPNIHMNYMTTVALMISFHLRPSTSSCFFLSRYKQEVCRWHNIGERPI